MNIIMILISLVKHENTSKNWKIKKIMGNVSENIRTNRTGFIRQQTGLIRQRISLIRQRIKPVCWRIKPVRQRIKPVHLVLIFLPWLLPATQSHGLDATPPTNWFIHWVIDSLTSTSRDKNKHVPDQTRPWIPKMFTDSEPPKKCRLEGLTRCAPNPPYGGAKDFFLEVYDWWIILTPKE